MVKAPGLPGYQQTHVQLGNRVNAVPPRSWLFAAGHNERHLSKVFDAGADAVVLDLEDAVPNSLKEAARVLVAQAATNHPCWVRVNRPGSDTCARDLEMLGGVAAGFRVPKVESIADVNWVAERCPGKPLDCAIESAVGLLNLSEIAKASACTSLSLGTIDLANDLGSDRGITEMLFARSLIVLVARAAGKPAPSDGIYPNINDEMGLRGEANVARSLGFSGKSAIHPGQVPIIHEIFSPSMERIDWARRVLQAFEASGGAATRLPDGEFVDLPVAENARTVLRNIR